MRRNENGFTLIELLIVVAIIGILAAIAIPNLLNAIQRAKQKRTMADIRSIATAWEARSTDFSRYNAAGYDGASTPIDLDALTGVISPTYMKSMPMKDGWANRFVVYSDQALGASIVGAKYAIASPGRDGIFQGTVAPGPFTSYDCDIIYANGTFFSYPEGMQK